MATHTQPLTRAQRVDAVGLSEKARAILIGLTGLGCMSDAHQDADGEWMIECHIAGPGYEYLWSALAWEWFCDGDHLPGKCQCKACQDQRRHKGVA